MARQADAEHRHRKPPGDFHVHHRERDGDADAPLQHLIQATVAGIEEIVFVAVKAQLAEQVALRGLDEIAAVVEIAQAVAQLRGQLVQLVEKRFGLKIRGNRMVASSSAARSRRPLGGLLRVTAAD